MYDAASAFASTAKAFLMTAAGPVVMADPAAVDPIGGGARGVPTPGRRLGAGCDPIMQV